VLSCITVYKCGIVDNILAWNKFKEIKELKKNDGKKNVKITGIPKLDDANLAGGKEAHKCTLILTEGDSAKALVLSGLSVIGRDYYGVFPLKGKLLNVKDAKHEQIKNNEEISNIKKILGLQHDKVYQDAKSLRYGHVMLMTDQDHDGSHIKGLLVNLFHTYWPSLLKLPGFLTQFITPIVKCSKNRDVVSFYTTTEYESWKNSLSANELKKWTIKYYKGLGTSTSKEAREYFSNILKHQIDFKWNDSEAETKSIELAFGKGNADSRKQWLAEFTPGTHVLYDGHKINYSEFIHKELIQFSIADNQRSIPAIMDGLKPGQRKILFCCLKKNIKKEIKVAQLAGIVSQMSAYHHGEASLCSTIVGIAQDFCGSNNINLLLPIGQFGTRHLLGKDAASARYIFTSLSPITRKLFHPDDDALLKYLDDDGKSVEPDFYCPIIPMVLVNGAEGIGTGWSTSIPNFNPIEIIERLKELINGASIDELQNLHPYYRGYKGTIEASKKEGTYNVIGTYEIIDSSKIRITEIPLHKSTQAYKEFLESLVQNETILDFEAHHTDSLVDFLVTVPEKMNLEKCDPSEIVKFFKLSSTISTTNMVLFNSQSMLKKYDSINDLILEFYEKRLDLYHKRKDFMVNQLKSVVLKLRNKARFIKYVVDGKIVISKRKKAEILGDLQSHGFLKFSTAKNDSESSENEHSDADQEDSDSQSVDGFEYLLSMKLWNLTDEKIKELNEEVKKREDELEILENTPASTMWMNDLESLANEIVALENTRIQDASSKHQKKQAIKKKNLVIKSRNSDDDSDGSDDYYEKPDKKSVKAKPKVAQHISKPLVNQRAPIYESDDDADNQNDIFSKKKASEKEKDQKSSATVLSRILGNFKQTKPSVKEVIQRVEKKERLNQDVFAKNVLGSSPALSPIKASAGFSYNSDDEKGSKKTSTKELSKKINGSKRAVKPSKSNDVPVSPLLKKVGNKLLAAFSPAKFQSPLLKKQKQSRSVAYDVDSVSEESMKEKSKKPTRPRKKFSYKVEDESEVSDNSVFVIDDDSEDDEY
jgi:DNA topoisomerase-2